MKKSDGIKLYAYDYDNTLISTCIGKIDAYYKNKKIIFDKDNSENALKLLTKIEFNSKNLKKYNLKSKQKFPKLVMIYNDLKNKNINLEDIKKEAKEYIEKNNEKDIKISVFNKFLEDLENGNLIKKIKENALNLLNKLEIKYEKIKSHKLKELQKNSWSLWNFIDEEKIYSNKIEKLFSEYEKNIKNTNNNSMEDVINKVFFPISSLYEIFANETIEINVDLMYKIINNRKNNKGIQVINSLKDKVSLLESMKIFKKIGNKHLKDFVKTFYKNDKENMILGSGKYSCKKMKIRSLEILYYPKVKEFIENKNKKGIYNIYYTVIGDSAFVDEQNTLISSKPGKDNYTLNNLFQLNENDLSDFKDLLKNEYKISKADIDKDNNLKNINNLNNYLKNNIFQSFVYETRLTTELKQECKKKDIMNINLKDIDMNNIEVYEESNKNQLLKSLHIIDNEDSVEKYINKKIDIIEEYNKYKKNNKHNKKYFTLKDKNDKEVRFYFNADKSDIRPLKENINLIKEFCNKDKFKEVYNEFLKNKKKYDNNFNEFLYKNYKKIKNHEKVSKVIEDYFNDNNIL